MRARSIRSATVLLCSSVLLCLSALFALCGVAAAKSINIMVIGASNANGKGVSYSESWPAILESMLKSKGYDAHVTVHATNGLTSTQIISYTSSISAGIQIVIFDAGISNECTAISSRGLSDITVQE
jgi:acyl-CoA thioesterase I